MMQRGMMQSMVMSIPGFPIGKCCCRSRSSSQRGRDGPAGGYPSAVHRSSLAGGGQRSTKIIPFNVNRGHLELKLLLNSVETAEGYMAMDVVKNLTKTLTVLPTNIYILSQGDLWSPVYTYPQWGAQCPVAIWRAFWSLRCVACRWDSIPAARQNNDWDLPQATCAWTFPQSNVTQCLHGQRATFFPPYFSKPVTF